MRHDGRTLIEPLDAELTEAIGGATRLEGGVYDVAVVGAGPAGLSAAVCAASEGLDTVVLEKAISGGQAGASSRIRNFPGFTWGIRGSGVRLPRLRAGVALRGRHGVRPGGEGAPDLRGRPRPADRGREGGDGARRGDRDGRGLAPPRRPLARGAGRGTGVFYGAASVTLLVRGDSLARSMSDYLVRALEAKTNVTVRLGVEVTDGEGRERLERVTIRERATGRTESLPASGLFVLIGGVPHTDWLDGVVERDPHGYVMTGPDLVRNGRLPAGWSLERVTIQLVHRALEEGTTRRRSLKPQEHRRRRAS